MARVVICGVARTPIGKFRGSLSNLSAVELGIRSVKELLNRCNINPSSGIIDEILFGQVLQAGAGQAPNIPQPIPKIADPIISDASIFFN